MKGWIYSLHLSGIEALNWKMQWEKTTHINLMPRVLLQGLVPAGIRLIPHTVLTFIFLEQLKKYFGILIISWARTVTGRWSTAHQHCRSQHPTIALLSAPTRQ